MCKNDFIKKLQIFKRTEKSDFDKEYASRFALNEESYLTLGLVFLSLVFIFMAKEYYSHIKQTKGAFDEIIKDNYISFIIERSENREIDLTVINENIFKEDPAASVDILSNLKPDFVPPLFSEFESEKDKLEKIISSLDKSKLIELDIITSSEKQEKSMELNPHLSDYDKDAYLEILKLYYTANLSLEKILEISRIERREAIKIEGPKSMLSPSKTTRQGIREKSEVDKVIDNYMTKLNYCYFKAKQKNIYLKGFVVIRFSIYPNGTIDRSSVRIIENSLKDKSVAICLKKQIIRIKGFSALPESNGKYYVTQKFSYE